MNIIIGALAVIFSIWIAYLVEINDEINPN